MNICHSHRFTPLFGTILLACAVGGCTRPRPVPPAAEQPGQSAATREQPAVQFERYDPDEHARSLGLSRLPQPLNFGDLMRALREQYPRELAGSRTEGRVLLSLDLDAAGVVVAARAVEPSINPSTVVKAVMIDPRTGERREIAPARGAHPALKRAAEKAAGVLRFSPAERDDAAVPFSDYRITVELGPPS